MVANDHTTEQYSTIGRTYIIMLSLIVKVLTT